MQADRSNGSREPTKRSTTAERRVRQEPDERPKGSTGNADTEPYPGRRYLPAAAPAAPTARLGAPIIGPTYSFFLKVCDCWRNFFSAPTPIAFRRRRLSKNIFLPSWSLTVPSSKVRVPIHFLSKRPAYFVPKISCCLVSPTLFFLVRNTKKTRRGPSSAKKIPRHRIPRHHPRPKLSRTPTPTTTSVASAQTFAKLL